jgi:hypothetical protein
LSTALELSSPFGFDLGLRLSFIKAEQQLTREPGPLLARKLECIGQKVIR